MITHPEKVLFPADGITKGELAAYYEAVAPFLVPYIKARPVTMERFPAGIDRKGFLQKDVSKGFPAWLQRVEVPKKGGTVHYPLVTDTRSLLWVVNQNTLTPHVWISRAPKLNYPDVCVFDLDPTEDEKPEVLRAAALALRRLLEDELGLPSWDAPSAPCLSSRVAYGLRITPERLRQVEAGEAFLRGIGVSGDLRVRHHGEKARLEVSSEHLARVREQWTAVVTFFSGLGFATVELDPAGYRRGGLLAIASAAPAL